ncbi:MAG: hypothetical protein AAF578_10220 [Pseudomonadota bacterium]
MNRRLRSTLLTLLCTSLVACASEPFGLMRLADDRADPTLLIIVRLTPPGLSIDSYNPTDTEVLGALIGGVPGALTGAALDQLTALPTKARARRMEEWLNSDELIDTLQASLLSTVESAVSSANLERHFDVTVSPEWAEKDHSSEPLSGGDSPKDYTVILTARLQVEGALDRIRSFVRHDTYEHNGLSNTNKRLWTREIVHLSQVREWVKRRYLPGERAALLETLNEQLVVAEIERPRDMASSMVYILKGEIEYVQDSTLVPPYIAVSDNWGPDVVGDYMPEVSNQLEYLLRKLWEQEVRPADFRERAKRFRYRSSQVDTRSETTRGYPLETYNGNDVFWTFDDRLISVPDSLAE